MNTSEPHLDKADGIEVWKHFAETGGNDKDRMVQVCNWLLSFSVAILGFAFAQGVKTQLVSEATAFAILAFFGFILSIVSGLVTLIYGGRANWNWAKADQIARERNWSILDPGDEPWTSEQKAEGSDVLARWGRCWAAPTHTYKQLAPIFIVYFALSLLSAGAHIVIIIVASCG